MFRILLLTLLFLPFVASGQIISVNQEEIIVQGTQSDNDLKADFIIINESNDSISLLWDREVIQIAEGWLSYICDEVCWGPGVDECPENKAIDLRPGQSTTLQVHVNPGGNLGEAEIDMHIYLKSDSTLLNTLKARFTNLTTSVNEGADTRSIQIFPNPATHYFVVSDHPELSDVVVYNIVGNPVKSFIYNPAANYDVANLPAGVYFIRLMARDQSLIKTIRLSKQ